MSVAPAYHDLADCQCSHTTITQRESTTLPSNVKTIRSASLISIPLILRERHLREPKINPLTRRRSKNRVHTQRQKPIAKPEPIALRSRIIGAQQTTANGENRRVRRCSAIIKEEERVRIATVLLQNEAIGVRDELFLGVQREEVGGYLLFSEADQGS